MGGANQQTPLTAAAAVATATPADEGESIAEHLAHAADDIVDFKNKVETAMAATEAMSWYEGTGWAYDLLRHYL